MFLKVLVQNKTDVARRFRLLPVKKLDRHSGSIQREHGDLRQKASISGRVDSPLIPLITQSD